MNIYTLHASVDGINEDLTLTLYKQEQPTYWDGYDIARRHYMDYFYITNEAGEVIA